MTFRERLRRYHCSAPTARSRGSTVIELCIVMFIMVFVLAALGYVTLSTGSAIEVHTAHGLLQSNLAEAISRVAVELRQSGTECPDWSISSTSITFNMCTGFDGVERTWSEPITYFLSESGELRRTHNSRSITLLRRVSALEFSQNGTLVDVSITAQQPSVEQQTLTRTISTRVFLNNTG